MGKNLVVAAASNYCPKHVRVWLNSLRATGYCGDILVILYNDICELDSWLRDRGVLVFRPQGNHLADYHAKFGKRKTRWRYLMRKLHLYDWRTHIGEVPVVVDRFFHLWQWLSSNVAVDYELVLHTDIRDVFFQADPFQWLEAHSKENRLVLSSEGLDICDEVWGRNNMESAYGSVLRQHFAQHKIYNAGVFAGTADFIRDIALANYLASQGTPIVNPDQSSLNILVCLEPYRRNVLVTTAEESFAAQLGIRSNEEYQTLMREPAPVIRDGKVLTPDGQLYCIVHQYDRFPELNQTVMSMYDVES